MFFSLLLLIGLVVDNVSAAIDNWPLNKTEHENLMKFWTEIGCSELYCAQVPVGTPCPGLTKNSPSGAGGYSGPTCSNGRVVSIGIGGLVPLLTGTFSTLIGSFEKLTSLEMLPPWQTPQKVPREIGRLSELTLLHMRGGVYSLPQEIGALSSLTQILVDGSAALGALPTSTLPAAIANLPTIRTIQITNSSIVGSVPDLSSMPKLTSLVIGGNALTGALRVPRLAGCQPFGTWGAVAGGYGFTNIDRDRSCFSSCTPADSPCCVSISNLCPANKTATVVAASTASTIKLTTRQTAAPTSPPATTMTAAAAFIPVVFTGNAAVDFSKVNAQVQKTKN